MDLFEFELVKGKSKGKSKGKKSSIRIKIIYKL